VSLLVFHLGFHWRLKHCATGIDALAIVGWRLTSFEFVNLIWEIFNRIFWEHMKPVLLFKLRLGFGVFALEVRNCVWCILKVALKVRNLRVGIVTLLNTLFNLLINFLLCDFKRLLLVSVS